MRPRTLAGFLRRMRAEAALEIERRERAIGAWVEPEQQREAFLLGLRVRQRGAEHLRELGS